MGGEAQESGGKALNCAKENSCVKDEDFPSSFAEVVTNEMKRRGLVQKSMKQNSKVAKNLESDEIASEISEEEKEGKSLGLGLLKKIDRTISNVDISKRVMADRVAHEIGPSALSEMRRIEPLLRTAKTSKD